MPEHRVAVDLKVVDKAPQAVQWDEDILLRHDKAGPRYTSYPTANLFHEEFTEADYRRACEESNRLRRPLSLYFHIPFCATVCYYCACNKIVTANRARAREYLDLLKDEMRMQAALFEKSRPVTQLHWGGGTPTFLSPAEMTELMHHTARLFHLLDSDRGEYSIEIDPRTVDPSTVGLLRGLGFNRMSLGVQDFDPRVQQAVNRVQSVAQVRTVTEAAREFGFRSISFDLIYGLPFQDEQTFRKTLDDVIKLKPDRLSVFNYAHLPARFKTQRQIDEAALPPASEKLKILETTIRTLQGAGYVYIGMDHFARPDDELAIAQRSGELHRNFQGYSTQREADLVGLGLSSIGQVGNCFAQNAKGMAEYAEAIRAGHLPVERGYELDADDRLRRDVIMEIACQNGVRFAAIEQEHGIRFREYFAGELAALEHLRADGLVSLHADRIEVTPRGRLLLRTLCMVFDRHLRQTEARPAFSRII